MSLLATFRRLIGRAEPVPFVRDAAYAEMIDALMDEAFILKPVATFCDLTGTIVGTQYMGDEGYAAHSVVFRFDPKGYETLSRPTDAEAKGLYVTSPPWAMLNCDIPLPAAVYGDLAVMTNGDFTRKVVMSVQFTLAPEEPSNPSGWLDASAMNAACGCDRDGGEGCTACPDDQDQDQEQDECSFGGCDHANEKCYCW